MPIEPSDWVHSAAARSADSDELGRVGVSEPSQSESSSPNSWSKVIPNLERVPLPMPSYASARSRPTVAASLSLISDSTLAVEA